MIKVQKLEYTKEKITLYKRKILNIQMIN